MSIGGLVTAVGWKNHGSELLSTVEVGDTSLHVASLVDFNDAGGWVELNEVNVEYTGVSADFDDPEGEAGYVELLDPLENPAEEGDMVVVIEAGGNVLRDFTAYVSCDEGDEIEVEIPYSERALWPEGIYDSPIYVELSGDLERIVTVPGVTPSIDGGLIDPDTLPGSNEPTEPPAESPTVVVSGTLDGLILRAVGLAPTSRVTFHITDTPPLDDEGDPTDFTPTPETAAGPPMYGTMLVVKEVRPDERLQLGVTYYVRAVAENDLGEAPPGPQVAAALDPENASEVAAERVEAGFVLAGEIEVGQIKISSPSEDRPGGIYIPQTDGGEIMLPADGSPARFSGSIQTGDLRVENNLVVNGADNAINGSLSLASTVTAPTLMPAAREELWTSPIGTSSDTWGLCEDPGQPTHWATIHRPSNTVRRYRKSDGAHTSTPISGLSGTLRAITSLDGFYFLVVRRASDGMLVLQRRSSSGALLGSVDIATSNQAQWWPGLGTDGTRVLVAWTTTAQSRVRVKTFTTGLTEVDSVLLNQPMYSTIGVWFTSVGRGPVGPGGQERTWLQGLTGVTVYGAGADPLFVHPYYYRGTWWTGTELMALGYYNYRVSPVNTRQEGSTVLDVRYTWYDSDEAGTGTHETEPSPGYSFTPTPWTSVMVHTPPPADDGTADAPDSVRIYINGHLQTVSGVPGKTSYLLDEIETSGVAPPTSNGFDNATSTPGRIKSAVGDTEGPLVDLRGDGSGRVGPWAWDASGRGMVPYILLQKNADQSIPNGAYTRVWWHERDYGRDEIWLDSSGQLTFRYPGMYLVTSSMDFAANATGTRYVRVLHNGANIKRLSAPNPGGVVQIAGAVVVVAGVGDTLDIEAYQSSGGALNVVGNTNRGTTLDIVRLV